MKGGIILLSTGKQVKKYRKEMSLTQDELAKMSNISRGYLSDIENDRNNPSLDTLKDIAMALNVDLSTLLLDSPQPKSYKIPVFGQVAAGNPIFASDEIIDYEEIPIEWKGKGEFFAVRLKGDSMLPRFAEGDVVIVRKQDSVDNGDLAIVLVNGDEATFKKVEKLDNGLMLIGLNSSYIPKVYTNEDIERLPVKIIGKVVEARIKL